MCNTCWKGQFSDTSGAAKGFISHWQGRYQSPPPPPPEAIRKDTAESLLRKLSEKKLPHYAGALYILAVMLERKRVLKVRGQVREKGQRIFIYEHAKTGDVFTIAEPDLSAEKLGRIQHDVAELMEKGLPHELESENGDPASPKQGTNASNAQVISGEINQEKEEIHAEA